MTYWTQPPASTPAATMGGRAKINQKFNKKVDDMKKWFKTTTGTMVSNGNANAYNKTGNNRTYGKRRRTTTYGGKRKSVTIKKRRRR